MNKAQAIHVKLYTDSKVFQKEYPSSTSIEDIKRSEGIVGRHRLKARYSNAKEYRVDNTGFMFEIREV